MSASPDPSASPASRPGLLARWARRLRWPAVAFAALLVAGYLYLTRDLEPHFAARRGELQAHEVEATRVDGADVVERVTLRSSSGLAVRLAVRRPDEATPPRRPVAILLGGHETGRDAIDLVPDTRGVVVVALDYPFEQEGRLKGLAVVPAIPRIQLALADTPAAIQLAADWIERQPWADAERLDLVGVSLGAPFACVAGGLDERFGRVWSVHGGALPGRMIEHGLERKIAIGPLRAVVARLAALLAYVESLDPARWAPRIAPREFLMINALDDERIPRECVDALYASASEPKEIVWLPGQHVDPKREQIVAELIGIVLDRIEAEAADRSGTDAGGG